MGLMDRFKRAPDEEIVVEAGKAENAAQAMAKWGAFISLVRTHDLDLVRSDGRQMVLRGRPKNVAAFRARYDLAKSLDAI